VRFPAVLPGRYQVQVSCPQKVEGEAAPDLTVGEEPIEEDFLVHERLAIRGIVVDEEGAPVSGSQIWIAGAPPLREGAPKACRVALDRKSDEEGRFAVSVPEPCTWEVRADGQGGDPIAATVDGVSPPPELRLVVQRRVQSHGRVIDETGRPLSRAAEIRIESLGPEGGVGNTSVDADGGFTIWPLPPERVRLSVWVHDREVPILAGAAEVTLPAEQLISLVVGTPPGLLEGRVVREDGSPARAQIAIERADEPDAIGLLDQVSTDAEGRFRAFVPPEAVCKVTARTRGGESAELAPVLPGGEAVLRLRAAARLRGRVFGAPRVFEVSVGEISERFVDTGGAWEIARVPAGTVTVRAFTGALRAAETLTVAPGETRSVDLLLEEGEEEDVD
jgi:hypothetical protein